MCFYVRMVGRVGSNLALRVCHDLADWAAAAKRRIRYAFCRLFARYDDVGPTHGYPPWDETACHQTNLVIGLEDKQWYHNVDRKRAQELVTAGGNGCFIVRPSSTHPLTLTVYYGHRAYNIPIRRREDGLVALGVRKQNERTFQNIEDLIYFHEKEELIMFSAGEESGKTVLSSTPVKVVGEKESKHKAEEIYIIN
ncbi:hypothetical protein AAG570_001883 [Ranatra chinensis]|uniref:SH2 domain-containing protein n=1 Tax=Ranatra chinensis TaxID=642074 RepID=A0ABD0Y9V4_9HEMI